MKTLAYTVSKQISLHGSVLSGETNKVFRHLPTIASSKRDSTGSSSTVLDFGIMVAIAISPCAAQEVRNLDASD